MNTTEERQVYLVGRILKRDPQRIKNLINQQKLRVPESTIDFMSVLLQDGLKEYNNKHIQKVYYDYYSMEDDGFYERITQLLCHTCV